MTTKETVSQFKTIVHSGRSINPNMLHKGIYVTTVPVLYNKETTIKNLIEQAETLKNDVWSEFITDKYLKNLRRCKMRTVTLQ